MEIMAEWVMDGRVERWRCDVWMIYAWMDRWMTYGWRQLWIERRRDR